MPPFDGEVPAVGVYAQNEPFTLTREAMHTQRAQLPGLLKARLQLKDGIYVPKTSGDLYSLLDYIDYLANNYVPNRPHPGKCYASLAKLGKWRHLKRSEDTVRRLLDRALELGLVNEEERAGSKGQNLYWLTPLGIAWHKGGGYNAYYW